jgi:hypothetical protein
MQRALTKQFKAGESDALDAAFRALPAEDPRREAWMCTDSCSSQWISTRPSKRDALSAAEFGEGSSRLTVTHDLGPGQSFEPNPGIVLSVFRGALPKNKLISNL